MSINTENTSPPIKKRTIGLSGALSIGIGGMVGGGIFALLGLTVELAKGGASIAFFIGGIICLITSYSYTKLSLTYPHEAGTVEFLNQGLGNNILSGTLNMLLWISYIVMVALYSFAFGNYGATFFPDNLQFIARELLIIVAVLGAMIINIIGAELLGKSEFIIVMIKVLILIVIIVVGFHVVINNKLDYSRLAVSNWATPFSIVAGGFLIFLAYEGFELIANSAEDIKHPTRNLPLAYYISVSFVILIYVLAAAITVGVLPVEKIVSSSGFVLAEVARVFLYDIGFGLVVIAAVLSTFSAIAATLYGNMRLTNHLAEMGQFPGLFKKRFYNKPVTGLCITSLFGIFIALTGDVTDISNIGSVGFLIIFFMVNFVNFKLRKKTNANAVVPLLGMCCCLFAIVTVFIHAWLESIPRLLIVSFILIFCFVFEFVYLRHTRRT